MKAKEGSVNWLIVRFGNLTMALASFASSFGQVQFTFICNAQLFSCQNWHS